MTIEISSPGTLSRVVRKDECVIQNIFHETDILV